MRPKSLHTLDLHWLTMPPPRRKLFAPTAWQLFLESLRVSNPAISRGHPRCLHQLPFHTLCYPDSYSRICLLDQWWSRGGHYTRVQVCYGFSASCDIARARQHRDSGDVTYGTGQLRICNGENGTKSRAVQLATLFRSGTQDGSQGFHASGLFQGLDSTRCLHLFFGGTCTVPEVHAQGRFIRFNAD